MRYGFDIYRITTGSTQEPTSPWGWTPRRGEVCTGEHVVQEHVRPELVFYPSAFDGCSPDATMFVSRQRRRRGLEDLFGRAGRRSA